MAENKKAASEADMETAARIAELEAQIAEAEAKAAKAEARADEAEAKAKAEAEAKANRATIKASEAPVNEKTVKIMIPLTREDQSDVFVSVNDRQWLIKRGEEVEVPECVYEVLRNQEKQMRKAVDFVASIGKKSE